jgi:hypothetical protein
MTRKQKREIESIIERLQTVMIDNPKTKPFIQGFMTAIKDRLLKLKSE